MNGSHLRRYAKFDKDAEIMACVSSFVELVLVRYFWTLLSKCGREWTPNVFRPQGSCKLPSFTNPSVNVSKPNSKLHTELK